MGRTDNDYVKMIGLVKALLPAIAEGNQEVINATSVELHAILAQDGYEVTPAWTMPEKPGSSITIEDFGAATSAEDETSKA